MCKLLKADKTILPIINYNPLYLRYYKNSLNDQKLLEAGESVNFVRRAFKAEITKLIVQLQPKLVSHSLF